MLSAFRLVDKGILKTVINALNVLKGVLLVQIVITVIVALKASYYKVRFVKHRAI